MRRIAFAFLFLAGTSLSAAVHGPEKGTLVIVGGAMSDPAIVKRFIELAGGPTAPIVIVPTAGEADDYDQYYSGLRQWRENGATNLTVLHTRDRKVADTEAFVKPIRAARGVFFAGGRQWRLADSYLNTLTHKELTALLARGGVIGGSSAGASILTSFMVRGDTKSNEKMIGDHTVGLGFLKNAAVDQHLLRRNRQFDMLEVIDKYPDLLGIGLDENTAIVVEGDRFNVIGQSYAVVYSNKPVAGASGRFYFLGAGDRFDMKERKATRRGDEWRPLQGVRPPQDGDVSAQLQPAAKWWSHIEFLANDGMNGRDTGSPEHRKAAEYVAAEFKKAGLEPGGTNGYFQPIRFRSRRIVEEKSSLQLVRKGGAVENVELGDEATFSMRIEPAPSVEAPIVFAGYGLQVPESKHDDLAGLDLKGKIVLLLTGGPSNIPGPLLAHYQSIRWEYLKKAGAIGVFSIQNPKGQDIPWDRSKLSRFMPSLAIADPALDETLGQQTAVTINPARAERFFTGSGHTFKELLALSNDGKVLPRFAIPATARVKVAIDARTIESDNVIGILRGTDPALRGEYVAISAHLDHVGVGEPINGDRIYNGAMDNASGIATLIETAAGAAARGGLKRSVIFAAVTAEEKGLLGSRYFANRPTVSADGIVANLNTDMFLPLFPLKSLVVQGLEESDLADDLKRVARPLALEVLSDPEPERNAFIRSDQYSFIKTGVPALSLKVGFTRNSPEHDIVRKWRAERYHAPSDDLAQPVDRQAAEDFGKVYLALVEAVANRPTRPQWNGESFFQRFSK
jgi:cyanophycinase